MNATATKTAQRPIRVGTSWTMASGATWTVIEVLPFGKLVIRSGDRFGDIRTSDARRGIAAAEARAAASS